MLARKSEPAPGPFTFEEYLEWEAAQEEKWELVDGYAVRRSDRWHYDPATGMAGATRAHNVVVGNLLAGLIPRLRGGPCRALPSDLKTRSRKGVTRYPDVTVECGSGPSEGLVSSEPRVLLEVLSPSNSMPDQLRLLDDYQAIETMQQVVFLEQSRPRLLSWTRDTPLWPRQTVEGLDALLEFPSLGLSLPLSEIYEGLDFG